MTEYVNAAPAKRFFVEMLIRDIRLEDAIIDLVDNAIDSLIRHEGIDLPALVTTVNQRPFASEPSHSVDIRLDDDGFCIKDNCGGIEFEDAVKYVFRFGAEHKPRDSRLSVYGIGLKRAVLKLGRMIEIESRTTQSGFRVELDVNKFEADSNNWRFPISELQPASESSACGTTIRVRNLNEEMMERSRSASFNQSLVRSIGESYALFLGHFVTVRFNGQVIKAQDIPISRSAEIEPSVTKESFNDKVKVTIVVGLQRPDGRDWRGGSAGWYIICNGRVVVSADRTELTGWGTRTLPLFQPKHRGFIGLALFMSEDPEALPWTTTKRGVNAEAPVFQFIRERMMADARQVISFLDLRYAKVPVSSENNDKLDVGDKKLQDALGPAVLGKLFVESPRRFSPSEAISRKTKTIRVQFQTEWKKIERARKAMNKPSLAAGKVGHLALDYFLDNEADE